MSLGNVWADCWADCWTDCWQGSVAPVADQHAGGIVWPPQWWQAPQQQINAAALGRGLYVLVWLEPGEASGKAKPAGATFDVGARLVAGWAAPEWETPRGEVRGSAVIVAGSASADSQASGAEHRAVASLLPAHVRINAAMHGAVIEVFAKAA
jgi:hypothetical protein